MPVTLYALPQLCVVLAAPIAAVASLWTVAIFAKNRHRWRPYDVVTVALVAAGALRALLALAYSLAHAIDSRHVLVSEHCAAGVALVHALHTFEASNLATLTLAGLLAVRLERRGRQLREFLTASHLVYHLCCLLVLCACVGVAATLAVKASGSCGLMPFELELRYNVFVLVLHAFLASVSFGALCAIAAIWCRAPPYDYTDTMNRYMDHVSTTTFSSTNSRRPCLRPEPPRANEVGALETIGPVLVVCYLVYHLPVMVLCVYPRLLQPWPVASLALWLGLIENLLVPIGLGLVDSRFGTWVADVYRCGYNGDDKIPHLVGLDGKFRPFGSQPQSLEASSLIAAPETTHRKFEHHRFPLTNGSLYTSIDGRLPVLHDRPRHFDQAPRYQSPLPTPSIELSSSESDASSSCSITTEANGDFEFYQTDGRKAPPPCPDFDKINNNFLLAKYNSFDTSLENFEPRTFARVRRSHSQRSLENFRAFLEDRSERHLPLTRSASKLSDCTHNIRHKIKSVEYLPSTNASTWLVVARDSAGHGSAPDLKKIFISEYI